MFIKPTRDRALRAKKSALDAVRAAIMLADAELKITYANPAALSLLRDAAADLQGALPGFNPAGLIGTSIEVFHKHPDPQWLKLDAPYSATINAGPHVFDLFVSPLSELGERIGYTVEWTDATARVAHLDYAAQLAAIDRSQAVIEFSPDGIIQHANASFLAAVGYSLPEIKGRHHRMFVTPEQAATPEYTAFWAALQRGEFQASRFRRVGKGGRTIWIEASYNPVLGEDGRVSRVIKFATDITAHMAYQASLETALGQIEASLAKCSLDTASAASVATTTLGNVQSVAVSADQLAASVQEIARSMAKSRQATEDVSAQAVAVGKSTEAMATAAQAMNGIAGLIRTVASQINLLALNATIEAARAGDAGKGFAVVASEVKNLAIQAAKATEQITAEIDGLQATSSEVAGSMTAIRDAMQTVREQVTLTASAVEEQAAVTGGMSTSLQTVADSVAAVSSSIAAIVGATTDVSDVVSSIKRTAPGVAR